jgi:hypothetical protein
MKVGDVTQKSIERSKKLFELGLKYDGETMFYEDINFHWTDLLCMTDEEFDKAYSGAVERKKSIDKAKEQHHG